MAWIDLASRRALPRQAQTPSLQGTKISFDLDPEKTPHEEDNGIVNPYALGKASFVCSPPSTLTVSPESTDFRAQVATMVSTCRDDARATSTVNTYVGLLSKYVPLIASKFSVDPILPLDTPDKTEEFYAALLLVGPKKPTPGSEGGLVRWTFVRQFSSALAAWHLTHQLPFALSEVRNGSTGFWAGLKVRCTHDSNPKTPMTATQAYKVIRAGAQPLATFSSSVFERPTPERKQYLLLRTATTVAIAFFGIRRLREVLELHMSDVTEDPEKKGLIIHIRKQKNDRIGSGQSIVIPRIAAWHDACPVKVILKWRDTRIKMLNEEVNLDIPEALLVTNLAGKYYGKPMATSGAINQIRNFFGTQNSTPSARKGGTQYYVSLGAEVSFTQTQGGWKNPNTMNRIYKHMEPAAMMTLARHYTQLSHRNMAVTFALQTLRSLDFHNRQPSTIVHGSVGPEGARAINVLYNNRAYVSFDHIDSTYPAFRGALCALLQSPAIKKTGFDRITAILRDWDHKLALQIGAQQGVDPAPVDDSLFKGPRRPKLPTEDSPTRSPRSVDDRSERLTASTQQEILTHRKQKRKTRHGEQPDSASTKTPKVTDHQSQRASTKPHRSTDKAPTSGALAKDSTQTEVAPVPTRGSLTEAQTTAIKVDPTIYKASTTIEKPCD